MIYNNLPLYEISISDDTELGMTCISIVDDPAIERNFLKFKEDKKLKFSIQEDEQKIFGPAIIPNKPIYRFDGVKEFYIVFTVPVIKEIVEKFSRDQNFNNISLYHDGVLLDNIFLTTIFIKSIDRGLNPVSFEDVPDGSLFVEYKVDDLKLWNIIKESDLSGFSVEVWADLINDEIDQYL